MTEPSNIWGISCEQFAWRLSNDATRQEFYLQGRSTVEELQEMLNNRIELVEALENMLGVFDTPIVRRKLGGSFADEARMSANAALAKAHGETK